MEMNLRNLMARRSRGAGPAALRCGLKTLSWFYGGAVRMRNAAYDSGWTRIDRAPVPVISVGNLTAGGTGKTPFVAYLANRLSHQGMQVVLLSRGYRAIENQTNDERRVLNRLCPNVPHLQCPDRVSAARRAVREHGAELVILDDGFQHRRLARDLDIVLIDALEPWGYGHLLPRGLLREPLSSLNRAHLVVLTRADQCPPEQRRAILDRIREIRNGDPCPCIQCAFVPSRLTNAAGQEKSLDSIRGARVAAFCGIGNPAGFRQTLAELEVAPVCFRVFPDHHHYTVEDLDRLGRDALAEEAKAVLTTQKDLVKIDRTDLGGCPLWAVEIGTRIIDGEDILQQRLQQVTEDRRPVARDP